eukprot:3297463-Rhodomonas_salina.3
MRVGFVCVLCLCCRGGCAGLVSARVHARAAHCSEDQTAYRCKQLSGTADGRLEAADSAAIYLKRESEKECACVCVRAPGHGGSLTALSLSVSLADRAEVEKLKAELANDDLKAMISGFASGTQVLLDANTCQLTHRNSEQGQSRAPLIPATPHPNGTRRLQSALPCSLRASLPPTPITKRSPRAVHVGDGMLRL